MPYLVIGCGSIGGRHACNLRSLGVTDILAYDVDGARVAALARRCEARPCASLDEAYGRKPGAALICAPTSLHLDLARQALGHGCHVFVEKPLSHSLQYVSEFLDQVSSARRVLLVGYNLRFDPLLQRLETLLKDRRVGNPISVRLHCGQHLPSRHPGEDYRVGYGARSDLGGGVILDSSHEIDYALWLFGMPDEVYCAAGKYSDLEIDVEDVAEIVLAYPSRLVTIHLDYVQRPSRRWCEVLGPNGVIAVDLVDRSLTVWASLEGPPEVYRPGASLDDVYVREMGHFLDCIDGNALPVVDGDVAARTLLIAERAKESAESGRRVAVDFHLMPGSAQ